MLELDTAADYSYCWQQMGCRDFIAEKVVEPEGNPWDNGLEPAMRAMLPASSSWVVMIVAVMLVLILFNFRSISRYIGFNVEDLLYERTGRDNLFDERPASFGAVNLLFVAILVVCGGFLLACGVARYLHLPAVDVTPLKLAMVVGAVLVYYIFEITSYNLVGYTFTTPDGLNRWIRGFNASSTLLATSLVIPALVAGFYPSAMMAMAWVGFGLFILAKVSFIFKGFRIFFDNLFSLLYFILYLCTLEIIPVILLFNVTAFLMI